MKGKTFGTPQPTGEASKSLHQSLTAASLGHRRSNSKHISHKDLSYDGASANNNLADLVVRSCGKPVVATVASGARYLGTLLTADLSKTGKGISVVLERPRLVQKPLLDEKSNADDALPERLIISASDLMGVEVTLPKEMSKPHTSEKEKADKEKVEKKKTPSPEPYTFRKTSKTGFRTDADISSGFHARERELQKWVPENDTAALSLEDDSQGAWDQFKVNEQKFGVGSTYDEHLYTTRIDTLAHDYSERLQRAEKLAREIEGNTSTSDRHVLEERGVAVDDSGMDEEDKYSGVHNDPVDTRGQELMAALRGGNGTKPQLPATQANYDIDPTADFHNEPAIISARSKKSVSEEKTTPEGKPTSIPEKPQVGANGESFRLNAQNEINSLREFSANFKVPHKMPNDLLPILAKDKEKQNEILKKLAEKKASRAAAEAKQDSKFKLNPNAASFTPSSKTAQASPVPPKANFSKPTSNASPRMNSLRAYGTATSGSGISKRHHQMSAAEFFGGVDKVPTAEGQKDKIEKVNQSFLLFAAARKLHGDAPGPVVLLKAFHTPPTWDSTVDATYEELLSQQTLTGNRTPSMIPAHTMPFLPNPLMAVPAAGLQMAAGGFPGVAGSAKYPVSPHFPSQASMAAQFQQQQYQAAMLYQQLFQGGMPLGQQHIMYARPGADPQFAPPGFIVPDFAHPGSPVGANMNVSPTTGYGNATGQNSYNSHQHHGKRYNGPSKRGDAHHA